jgi:hypothetical protein
MVQTGSAAVGFSFPIDSDIFPAAGGFSNIFARCLHAALQAQAPKALLRLTVQAMKIGSASMPAHQEAQQRRFGDFDANSLVCFLSHGRTRWWRLMFLLCMGTGAVGAIAPTAAFWRMTDDRASLGGDFSALVSFEIEAFEGQMLPIQAALEGAAAKRVQCRQLTGVDINLPLAVVLFMEQVDQFPGGTAVKVAAGPDMQIAVAFFEFDLEIVAHEKASISLENIN